MTRTQSVFFEAVQIAVVAAVAVIVVYFCAGCAATPPPIALYAEPNATDLAATRDRMTAAVRAYGSSPRR